MAGADDLAGRLAAGGFVSAGREADALRRAAGGDPRRLDRLVRRRLTGEPLAWIVGAAALGGVTVRVEPGVYVPRPHTEVLVARARARLPADGTAVDVGTGSGAFAAALQASHPGARVLATDVDPSAVACARTNGVDAHEGDLLAPLPPGLRGAVDLVVGVVPYVPTGELRFQPRDTFSFESTRAYDGGPDGTDVLRRLAHDARSLLRTGGGLVLELGGDQAIAVTVALGALGYRDVATVADADGDVRGVEATLGSPRPSDASTTE